MSVWGIDQLMLINSYSISMGSGVECDLAVTLA
ncbi:Unannotated [Lentimonas sp. CC19]|nr:Unannotated [Lentimonas sp. CC4]CAA6683865.1 Unannotated [Lentimonas sp. CC6]CAA6692747.1 Unannotated [Lentimonas sp. CC10]CAA6696687.1 Unannotated [Lentimonas sp. CC19]CAA7072333.1 Unannotated [Lentimonas sp. CC11]CAA7169674.1 Unannotated [Lentimonas sp. CC21]CAA7179493.1 Unannotated [Lentimonas sp. CC8]